MALQSDTDTRLRSTSAVCLSAMVWAREARDAVVPADWSPVYSALGQHAYIYGPDGTPFEQVDKNGTIHYLTADALGSVRGVVDDSGTLVGSTAYDAWGDPETTGGVNSLTHVGFAGGYIDPTGLSYLLGRYYDPTTGQFLTVDPDVDETGQAYAYTGDDPVNVSDISGRCTNFNLSCWISNEGWIWSIQHNASGKVFLTSTEATKFLISNGFTASHALQYISSFGTGAIYITLAENIGGSIYRYYGGTSKQGYFFTNVLYCDPMAAKIGLALPARNTARYVAQVSANGEFGQDLVLEGPIAGGDADATQFVAFDPNEFEYGNGVQTGNNPPPAPFAPPGPGIEA